MINKIPPTQTAQQQPRLSQEQDAQLKKVAQQFESIFVNQMVEAMRRTVVKQGMVPESQAEKIYQSMLDQEYSSKVAESARLGLSEIIYQHLLRTAGQQ